MKRRERKEQQRQYVERLLNSELSVAEWCSQNNLSKQTMYGWLNAFADTEPDLFGGADNISDRSSRQWIELTRKNIAASRQLALRPAPGVVLVDTLYDDATPPVCPSKVTPAHTISVELRGANIHIPRGAAQSDISAVLKAIAEL